MTPDPVPIGYMHMLCHKHCITSNEAARMLHITYGTIRKWMTPPDHANHRETPWAAAELLRRMLEEQ